MTPDDIERLLDGTRRHGADPAEILRQNQIGIDRPYLLVVQCVDGSPCRHPLAYRRIDLLCSSSEPSVGRAVPETTGTARARCG